MSAGDKTVFVCNGIFKHNVQGKQDQDNRKHQQGTIFITLRRSVEWLAKSTLRTRLGDAGPYMYVPEARDERKTDYETAFLDVSAAVRSPEADTCAPVRVDGTQLRGFPAWPVSASHAAVDPAKLDALRKKIEELTREQQQARQRLSQLSEQQNALEYHRAKHAEIRLERELLELELSIALNEETAAGGETPEGQEKIRTLGERLNFSRRQRRTYDYILSLFENQ